VTVSFVPLQDFNDSWFSSSVSFVQLQGLSSDCFILLRDFNDDRFCSVNDAGFDPSCDLGDSSFFFHYEISKTVSDGRFYFFTRPQ